MLRPDLSTAARDGLDRLPDFALEAALDAIAALCESDGRYPRARVYGGGPEEELILMHSESGRRMLRILFRVERRDGVLRVIVVGP